MAMTDSQQHDPSRQHDITGDTSALSHELPQVPRTREPAGIEHVPASGLRTTAAATLTATHCTIAAADVVGFGDPSRNNSNQVRVRRGLYSAMQYAFNAAGIPWERCRREDRGDGALILAPAEVPKALFVDWLPDALADALTTHNKRHPAAEQIHLRLALHAGEIIHDEHGVTSASITHTFRILDADALKSQFAESSGVLAVIGSAWFYDEVIRHSDWSQAGTYDAVDVTNKETTTRAWIRVVGSRRHQRRDPRRLPLGQRRKHPK